MRNIPTHYKRRFIPYNDAIENVDAVLYSHLHYDHFNKDDIKRIGSKPTYFVHLDTALYLPDADLQVSEMDWFTSTKVGQTTVSSIPAHHFNSRYWVSYIYNDDEQALWDGWLLEHEGTKLLFAEDTGYSPLLRLLHMHSELKSEIPLIILNEGEEITL